MTVLIEGIDTYEAERDPIWVRHGSTEVRKHDGRVQDAFVSLFELLLNVCHEQPKYMILQS